MMPTAVMRLRRTGGAPASSFYSLVMAQAPINYWRNGEASGSVMVDEVAVNGTYFNSPTLGNPALYPGSGAGTSVGGNFGGVGIVGQSSVFPASLTAMTLLTIIRPTDLSGFHLLGVQRDENSVRFFQWRSNGAAMEFVKIAGGVATLSQPGMLAINTTYFLGFETDAAGNYAMYRNGVSVQTGNMGAGNYGGAGEQWSIGYSTGASTNLVGTTCENAIFNKVLGPTVHAALFAATGL